MVRRSLSKQEFAAWLSETIYELADEVQTCEVMGHPEADETVIFVGLANGQSFTLTASEVE